MKDGIVAAKMSMLKDMLILYTEYVPKGINTNWIEKKLLTKEYNLKLRRGNYGVERVLSRLECKENY